MATVVAPIRRSRSQSKLVFFVIFGLLTVFVTYMKNARIFDSTSEIAQHFAPIRWYLVPHAFLPLLPCFWVRSSSRTACGHDISRCTGS